MAKQKEIQTEDDIKGLIKNFNLLRIVEKIELRKTTSQKPIVTTSETKANIQDSYIIESNKKINLKLDRKSNNNKEDIIVDYNSIDNKCKKHGLELHSYAIGTNMLFCDKCCEETNLKVFPLPNVVKEIKRKVDSNQLRICLIRHEINRLNEFFDSYQ